MKKNLAFVLPLLLLLACNGDKKEVFYSLKVEVRPEGAGEVEFPKGPFEDGKQVILKAVPAEGYLFAGWSGSAGGTDNPLTITMNADKNVVAAFEKKTYELKVTREGEGLVNEEIVKDARMAAGYPHGTTVRLTAVPGDGWYFENWEGDLTGKENPAQLVVNAPREVKAIFKEDRPVDLLLADGNRELFVSESRKLEIKVKYASGREEIADHSELTIIGIGGEGMYKIEDGNILAFKSGGTGFHVVYKGFMKLILLSISPVEDVQNFDAFLKTPVSGAEIEVPVVVINYLPTLDGVNLDMNRAPDDYWELKYSTLAEAKKRIEGELKITKFGIEEGTRYRQFGTNEKVNPYAGFRVVKYFNVYEMKMTDFKGYPDRKTPDYHDLFPKLGIEDLVNNHGVKEIWITLFNKDEKILSVTNGPFNDPSTYYGIPESNMSSPLTGDISNSYRDQDDLPIYKHTYVVYGNSGHRGADTNLHNRGHQIEAQFYFIDLIRNPQEGDWVFWNHFVGVPRGWNGMPSGRVGMTHFPPNAERDYDYDNPRYVRSDIRNWRPEGGDFSEVNNQLWKSRSYSFDMVNSFTLKGAPYRNDYTNDPHTKWLIYWWQAIPGKDNGLSFHDDPLTNWWHVFYNWDEVIGSLGGLVEKSSGNARLNLAGDRGNSPVCTHVHLP